MIKKIRRILGYTVNRGLYHTGLKKNFIPPSGRVNLGDLNRTSPFSKKFGYDRGGPVDRYYIRGFLERESGSIRGRVIEIGDNSYSLLYGGDKVTRSDILHVDDSNPQATFIGDLSNAPHLPDNTFDCFVLTQTLHLIYDFKSAIKTCHRILKPGGTLLITVPGISLIDYNEWGKNWFWSFTDRSMKKIMDECFPGGQIEVNNYGNVLVASSFLYGMSEKELTKDQLDAHDSSMQVIITVKAVKSAGITDRALSAGVGNDTKRTRSGNGDGERDREPDGDGKEKGVD